MAISSKLYWKSNIFDNTDLDSICVLDSTYSGKQNIVLVTAKEANKIYEFDLSNGKLLDIWPVNSSLNRPNGIANYKNFVLIVERDNKQLTIYNYLTKQVVLKWGNNILKKPYGISIGEINDIIYVLITDDGKDKTVYKLSFKNNMEFITYVKIIELDFRSKLESIYLDTEKKVILVADEAKYLIYIYDFYTNKLIDIFGERYFNDETEGISKYKQYYICTQQSKKYNTFFFFDDELFDMIYKICDNDNVSNTDGICVFQNFLLAINNDKQLVAYYLENKS